MKAIRPILLLVAVVASTVLAPVAATAESAVATHGQSSDKYSFLRLSLSKHGSEMRTAALKCHPAGGTHTRAAEACGQLDAANGNFNALAGSASMTCTMQYAPVTVTAIGQWRGAAIHFTETYPNTCVLTAKMNAVFDL